MPVLSCSFFLCFKCGAEQVISFSFPALLYFCQDSHPSILSS